MEMKNEKRYLFCGLHDSYGLGLLTNATEGPRFEMETNSFTLPIYTLLPLRCGFTTDDR